MIYGASTKQQSRVKIVAYLSVLCLLAGLVLNSSGGSNLPTGAFDQNAAVTIKTQEAADSVPNGIRGIDVSIYQGNINWSSVAQDNVQYAMIRASYGRETDKNFYTNVNGATNAGLKVGAYHYAKFTDRSSMVAEANYFINVLSSVKSSITYPVVLDLEGNAHKSMGRNTLTPLAIEFMDMLQAEGYTVLIYSYDNFFRDCLNLSTLQESGYDYWVANYIAEPGRNQVMWQHTSYGAVSGISGQVDINIAYKDLSTRTIRVDRTVSDSIIGTLNSRHGAGLPTGSVDMALMKSAVVTALQSELVRQLDADLAITGVMDAETLNYLDTVPFNYNETSGNITYLIQVMLFYRGHYTQDLNYSYDAYMSQALERYQRNKGIEVTGEPDRATLWYLFS